MRRTSCALAATLCAGALAASAARASENGASIYLLGSGGPGTAEMPPIEGVFFANSLYYYDASLGGQAQLPLHGRLTANVDVQLLADFATVLWVPTTDFAGGTLALGAALPVGEPDVTADLVVVNPLAAPPPVEVSESKWIVGDPLLTAMLGWKHGKTAIQASGLLNVPIGDYRAGHISNLAFHRWALDTSLAITWRDEMAGWDLSSKAGVTFNGQNEATDYTTGTEFHLEGSVEKLFSPAWSAGLQAYWFHQLSGDSGAGAVLGPFKGEVTGLGATAAHNFKIAGKIPASLRLHAFHEFDAKNRPSGDSVFLDFSMPLWVKLPPGAAPP